MSPIYDKETLYAAIDNYSLLTKSQKTILKSMIQISIDNEVVASIDDLSKLTSTRRATVSAAINMLEKIGIIEVSQITGIRFSTCMLKQSKLNEVVAHHQKKKQLMQK